MAETRGTDRPGQSRVLVRSLLIALVVVPAVPILIAHLTVSHEGGCTRDWYLGSDGSHIGVAGGYWSPLIVMLSLLASPAAAAVLSYAAFVVGSHRPQRTTVRYALGLPVAFAAWTVVLVIAARVVLFSCH